MKKNLLICGSILLLFVFAHNLRSQGVKQVKLTDFSLQSSVLVDETGEMISSPAFNPDIYWFPVKVPCTVLTGLTANNIYPDPYSGLNNMLIPDASDEFNRMYGLEKYSHLPGHPNPWKKPYWYRTKFHVPEEDRGRHFQLIFKGINYRAAVWVNGIQIADSAEMAGMFSQYSLDISKHVRAGEENGLAVKIYPLDYPGLPDKEQLEALGDFYLNGGPTGDIGKNVTMLCSVGWDWIPPVRDRNMGIWLPVYLRTSGGVTFSNPRLVTDLPDLPDTSLAGISLNLRLVNHTAVNTGGTLHVKIAPENFTGRSVEFTKPVSINSGESVMIDLNPANTSELNIRNPALWWPNGHGRPDLYRLRLQYSDHNGIVNDTSFIFGIRTVATKAVSLKNNWRRDFYVNGRRIHLTGGAWVPDMMLNRDSLRYDYELRLCRNAKINLVRIWGGGVTPCDEFFEAADRYGLLVWSDFWITGDTQGEFKGSPDWPLESTVFMKNVTNTICRIRNHPSLLVWTGGNEGHARRELYDFMRNSIIELDGTRPFIPSSSGFARLPEGWPGAWPDNLPTGVYSGGPYSWQNPESYYERVLSAKDWVFKDETGIPSMVTWDILPKIIPNLVWDKSLPFPLNHSWGYHDAATGNGRWDLYYKETLARYGEPESMEDFCNKMQLMNAEGYQGIFEAAGHKLNDVGGVMLWKLNAAFPSVVWQVYDWYLQTNAGYYSMQNACEPLHIQLNLLDLKVTVLNRRFTPAQGLRATVEVYDTESGLLYRKENQLSMGPSEVKVTESLAKIRKKHGGILFIVLNLKNSDGETVSHNAYWHAPDNDFRALADLPAASVSVTHLETVRGRNDYKYSLNISNNSGKIAFFVRPRLMLDGEEILPSLWSSNYITLAPSESLSLSVSCPAAGAGLGDPFILISGWNVEEQVIKLGRK
ncbi:MAG TPA: glycoside hydrolase family 2 TIM barrel-domain containing protein [Bacteroidales bacterium]|nr:glycoside hydrolase family 2 TIM barrel-domain containing protein [Bacteroidales bacterium]HQJ82235.1 glycoside hydrolase family 2 TIM barrel-domain containing protein [Bacteroidales bacterium]